MYVRKVVALGAVVALFSTVFSSDALAASNKTNWARAGKVLTGVAAVSVVAAMLGGSGSVTVRDGDREHDRDRDRRRDDRPRFHDDRRPAYYPPRQTVYYRQPTVYRTVVVERPVAVEERTVYTYADSPRSRESSRVYWER